MTNGAGKVMLGETGAASYRASFAAGAEHAGLRLGHPRDAAFASVSNDRKGYSSRAGSVGATAGEDKIRRY